MRYGAFGLCLQRRLPFPSNQLDKADSFSEIVITLYTFPFTSDHLKWRIDNSSDSLSPLGFCCRGVLLTSMVLQGYGSLGPTDLYLVENSRLFPRSLFTSSFLDPCSAQFGMAKLSYWQARCKYNRMQAWQKVRPLHSASSTSGRLNTVPYGISPFGFVQMRKATKAVQTTSHQGNHIDNVRIDYLDPLDSVFPCPVPHLLDRSVAPANGIPAAVQG